MEKLYRNLILLLLLTSATAARCQTDMYGNWQNVASDKLIDKGNAFFFAAQPKPDSSLVCFSVVANRLAKASSTNERRQLSEAYMGLWLVYFFSYFDYAKSFEYLEKSKTAAQGIDDILPRVYLNYGNMYMTLASQWKDKSLSMKAIESLRLSLNGAAKNGSEEIANLAFANMVNIAYTMGYLGSLAGDWKVYQGVVAKRRETVETTFTKLLYRGYQALARGGAADAVRIFRRQLSLLPDNVEMLRLRFNAYESIGLSCSAAGDKAGAEAAFDNAERLAKAYDMKDAKLEIYEMKRDFYKKQGNSTAADRYGHEYFMLKDSLQNYQQVMGVSELEFLGKIDAANKQVENMRQRQRVGLIVLFIAVCFVAIVGVAFAAVRRKNRQLRSANLMLYSKFTKMLAAEDEMHARHKSEISRLLAAKADAENAAAKALDEAGRKAETAQSAKEPAPDTAKYRKSGLSEQGKEALMEAIREVMSGSDEIYSADFNINRLAELVDSNYKYVSQVINERSSANFNSFLNEYRIKEACRRINSGKFDNYTIEALSNSVGFKSRMSFFTAFKNNTGLSPSVYIRIAKENKNKENISE